MESSIIGITIVMVSTIVSVLKKKTIKFDTFILIFRLCECKHKDKSKVM